MKKKKIAFLFGFTPNLAFAAGNAALSINRHISIKDYDIVMYYTDLPEQDKQALQKIPHVRLKQFNLPQSFIEHMLTFIPTQSRFRTKNHLMCFCHFEVFALLDEYENVIWNDVDIGVQGDLSDILEYTPFGLTPDTPWKVRDQFTQNISGYNMDLPAYCSSVMIANDTLEYRKIHKWLYEKAIQYAPFLVNPDQAIINLMLQQFHLSPQIIPLEEYNCISWREDANIAKIAHFGTEKKVWNDTNICNSFPEWYRTHLTWLALGGSDFDRSKITPRNPRGALDYLDKLMSQEKKETKQYVLFKCLPVLKIKTNHHKTTYYLFGIIPLLCKKEKRA